MLYSYAIDYPITPKQARVVFLIDDDELHLEVMSDFINKRFVVELHTFKTGEEALANLHLKPELCLLDYQLNAIKRNAMDGIHVLNAIRQELPLTQVVMFSGQENIAIAADCIKNGAFDYIIKGETAFPRLENLFRNVDSMLEEIYFKNLYKLLFNIVGFSLIAFAIFMIYAVNSGLATLKFNF